MRKFSLLVSSAVVGLGMIANANAATQNSAGLFEVNLPNFQQNWFKLSAEGNYLSASTGSGNYTPNGGNGPAYQVNQINDFPKSDLGFAIGAAWYIPGTSNDIAANYQHFNTSDNTHFIKPGVTGNQYLNGNIGVSYQNDIYDLTLGQNVNFGKNLNARFFLGARATNLKVTQDFTNYDAQPSEAGMVGNLANTTTTSITAIGPRIGLEGIYHVWNGFGVSGTFGLGALIGDRTTNTTNPKYNAATNTMSPLTTSTTANDSVIFNFDMKAGVNYTYQTPVYALTGEVGYKVNSFANAIRGAIQGANVTAYQTNALTGAVVFQGPYAKVSVMF